MLPDYAKRYLITALEGTPAVLSALTGGIAADSAVWDARPDADRFTLREMIAHLADWETVCRARIARTATEETPFLPNWDEEQAAVIGDYAHTSSHESLLWFAERRAVTVAQIASLTDNDWARSAERENVGTLSVEAQVCLILAHDGYHLRQAVEGCGA